jgi:hypothetical protein
MTDLSIVAENAKLMTDEVNRKKDSDQYTMIKSDIIDQMKAGNYDTSFYNCSLRPGVRSRLLKEGYRIGPESQTCPNELGITIYWG